MASPANNFNFPYLSPPPPIHPFRPPPPSPPPPPHVKPPPAHVRPQPPHVLPPPPPLPPAPSPSDNTSVIVIVFVSFGGLILLACLLVALCFCYKNKKNKERVDETVRLDEHLKVKESIVEGPHGPQAVVLEVEDDVHVNKVMHKDDEFGKKGLHCKPLEIGSSSSATSDHPHLQN